jgi:RNA polymerase sigma-70 factor (ECF subfamily)
MNGLPGNHESLESMVSSSDKDMIQRLKKGDTRSLCQLYKNYHPRVFSTARDIVKNDSDAEEIVQDVFLKVFQKIKGFEEKASLSSWIFRIAINTALMKHRRNSRKKYAVIDTGISVMDVDSIYSGSSDRPDDIIIAREIVSHISAVISSMREKCRHIFFQVDVLGCSKEEVAVKMNMRVGAVKSRLYRSRLHIKANYDRYMAA